MRAGGGTRRPWQGHQTAAHKAVSCEGNAMARSVRSTSTALLKCESCSHSSLVDLGKQSWLVRLIHCAARESHVRATCSNCGATDARLFHGRAGNPLVLMIGRLVGAARAVPNAGVAAKE